MIRFIINKFLFKKHDEYNMLNEKLKTILKIDEEIDNNKKFTKEEMINFIKLLNPNDYDIGGWENYGILLKYSNKYGWVINRVNNGIGYGDGYWYNPILHELKSDIDLEKRKRIFNCIEGM